MLSLYLLYAAAAAAIQASPCQKGCITLPSGQQMPLMALTTDDGQMAHNGACADMDYDCIAHHAYNLSVAWLAGGGRHLDTGNHYKTQMAVAAAIRDSGLNRSDVFLTTKCPGTIGYDATIQCVDDNLQMLGQFGKQGVGYIDLLLIHYAGKISPECRFKRGTSDCDPPFGHLEPITRQDALDTWRAMEKLRALKVVRSLGVSIFTPEQMGWILENKSNHIDVYQKQFVPANHNDTLLAWAKQHRIQLQARAAIDGRTPSNAPAVIRAAKAHDVSTAEVELRWLLQLGLPICANPLTTLRVKEYLGAFDFTLTSAEMDAISSSASPKADTAVAV